MASPNPYELLNDPNKPPSMTDVLNWALSVGYVTGDSATGEMDRPWTYDVDARRAGQGIVDIYKGVLDTFNSKFGKNYANQYTTVESLPVSAYAASLPAEHKGTGGMFGGFADLGLDILSSPLAQIGLAIITSGLSLPQQMAIAASVTIARGGSVEDVLKSAIGSLAASELSGFVKGLEEITDPTVRAALANSVSAATKAAATGGDIGQALLAGAVGGVVSSETQLATDSNAIARAAGEYAKALAAGQTQEQALTGALSGFILQEDKDKAAPLIQAEAEKINAEPTSGADVVVTPYEQSSTPISSQQVTALPDDSAISSADTSNLPFAPRLEEVVTSDSRILDESPEPITSQRDSQIMDLTGITSDEPSSKAAPAAKKKDTIMLSGIGASGAETPATRAPAAAPASTGGQAPAGSQALAQALRTGDVGDPLFGRKGKSNRPVWNIESLRTKDEMGD